MAEFMQDDFRAIFDNPLGTRRAIISRGRKNAKTVETAMLMLLFLCGPEAKPNSQLFSAAQSRDQASVLFALAAKMIRMSPDLAGVCGIDAVLLVVAADESVMPQTREHVAICRLLDLPTVIALTRCDLADETMQTIAEDDRRGSQGRPRH